MYQATHYNDLKEPKNQRFSIIFRNSFLNSTLMTDLGVFFFLSWQEYFQNHHGDWLAVDFKAAKERDELSRHFKVEGIPSFLADWWIWWIWGRLIDNEGRYHDAFSWCFCYFFCFSRPLFNNIHTDSYLVIMH